MECGMFRGRYFHARVARHIVPRVSDFFGAPPLALLLPLPPTTMTTRTKQFLEEIPDDFQPLGAAPHSTRRKTALVVGELSEF